MRKRGEGIETREHWGLLKIEGELGEGIWLWVGQVKEGGLQHFLNTQEVEKREGLQRKSGKQISNKYQKVQERWSEIIRTSLRKIERRKKDRRRKVEEMWRGGEGGR